MRTIVLPKEIIDKFHITYDEDEFYIHSPVFINIKFDDRFEVECTDTKFRVVNYRVVFNANLESNAIHITIL